MGDRHKVAHTARHRARALGGAIRAMSIALVALAIGGIGGCRMVKDGGPHPEPPSPIDSPTEVRDAGIEGGDIGVSGAWRNVSRAGAAGVSGVTAASVERLGGRAAGRTTRTGRARASAVTRLGRVRIRLGALRSKLVDTLSDSRVRLTVRYGDPGTLSSPRGGAAKGLEAVSSHEM